MAYLDFEKPIIELEKKIEELESIAEEHIEMKDEISRLQKKADEMRRKIYSSLNRWQVVQMARHPDRPYTLDYINMLFTDWTEFHGDRLFADDPAIVAGFGKLDGETFTIIGHQKGRTTKEKIYRNFGMPNPEGYRKAMRIMKLGARFGKPIISFIDTPGAYPGIGAEERGQALAIAENIRDMAVLPVPIIIIITGEGGSGGALAIGIGDVVLILEYAVYSVISPEGCASILWRDAAYAPQSAEALKLTSKDLKKLNIVDEIIKEPDKGAHREPTSAAENIKKAILKHYKRLKKIQKDELIRMRINKFGKMGVLKEK